MFNVVYADPPWIYNSRKAGGERRDRTKFGGGASKHYNLMSIPDICALPVASMSAPNSALFMWATMPHLPNAFRVMDAWGFRYVTTAFVWVKTTSKGWAYGPGYYTASNAEIVLLGVRGKMPPKRKLVQSVIAETRSEHSRKPDAVYERIEAMYDGPYLELFARRSRQGWSSLGDQLDSNIQK